MYTQQNQKKRNMKRDLILSKEGHLFILHQRRLFRNLRDYVTRFNLDSYFRVSRPTKSVVPGIASGELLVHIAHQCGAHLTPPTTFTTINSPTPSGHVRLQAFIAWTIEQGIAENPPLPEHFFTPSELINAMAYLSNAVEFLSAHRDIGLEASQDQDTPPTAEEVRGAIDLLGPSLCMVPDVNDDYQTLPSMFRTGAWVVYLTAWMSLQGMIVLVLATAARLKQIAPDDFPVKSANLSAVFNLTQLFANPVLNSLSDRVGRKRVMVCCYLLYTLSFFMMSRSPLMDFKSGNNEYLWLLFWKAMSGFAAMITPIGNTILADICPLKQRTQAMALLNGATKLGVTIGPWVAVLFSQRFEGTAEYFVACGKFAAASMLLTAWIAGHLLPETAPLKRASDALEELRERNEKLNSQQTDSVYRVSTTVSTPPAQQSIHVVSMEAVSSRDPSPAPLISPASESLISPAVIVEEESDSATAPTVDVRTLPDTIVGTLRMVLSNSSLILIIIAFTMSLGGHVSTVETAPAVVLDSFQLHRDYLSYAASVRGACGFLFSLFLAPLFSRKLGERAMTFLGQVSQMLSYMLMLYCMVHVDRGEAVSTDTSMLLYGLFVGSQVLTSLSDTVASPAYLAMMSLFTTPKNRGRLLSVGQIGNSVARSIPTLIAGRLFDWSSLLTYILLFVYPVTATVLTAVARPTIQRTDLERIHAADELLEMDVVGHRIDPDALARPAVY
eukprot:gnl/Dysnectes_brevis/3171_a3955_658.p1 GENE.gnl/Dysnectes_brevis/3171_a3955_658~~gnl/Dysnectes_brevis/3171_a3955_658.p1  ORF type:complete len:727 (-),score=218.99 gnl/Dysnectes_brevis/3171_a3955_658:127-2307(-)